MIILGIADMEFIGSDADDWARVLLVLRRMLVCEGVKIHHVYRVNFPVRM